MLVVAVLSYIPPFDMYRPLKKTAGDGKHLSCRTEKDKHTKLNQHTAGTYN